MPYARISFTDANSSATTIVAETMTNYEGNMLGIGLRGGMYEITITASGYMDVTMIRSVDEFSDNNIEIQMIASPAQPDLLCEVGGLITVWVYNGGKIAIAGVTVRFRKGIDNFTGAYASYFDQQNSRMQEIALITDANGRYYTNLLPYGYYTMEATYTTNIGSTITYRNIISAVSNWNELGNWTGATSQNLELIPIPH